MARATGDRHIPHKLRRHLGHDRLRRRVLPSTTQSLPQQVFNIARLIEPIIGLIIGGPGTLFWLIVGAFLPNGLAEILTGVLSVIGL
jgi:hypothetical protein